MNHWSSIRLYIQERAEHFWGHGRPLQDRGWQDNRSYEDAKICLIDEQHRSKIWKAEEKFTFRPPRARTGVSLRKQECMECSPPFSFTWHFLQEFQLRGRRHNQLHWMRYQIVRLASNGVGESRTDLDVSNGQTFPTLHFSRVKSYTVESETSLMWVRDKMARRIPARTKSRCSGLPWGPNYLGFFRVLVYSLNRT